ncbi:MAG: glycosyltransferase family 4 protein, partial [Actinomycetota bacterium]|nr:glycosyltransferase family 4 protein [Actinomycetota bacterium]
MRIAIVCPYAWDRVGGVQTHISALRSQLAERGHDVIVVAPASFGVELNGSVARAGRSIGIPANGSVAPLAFGPGAAIGLKRVLSRCRPDVVHAHEPLIPSVSLIATQSSRVPVVGTFHAAADSSVGYRVARPVLARAAGRLSVRTAVSDEARSFISKYFPGTYRLTPNGVDFATFRDAAPADLGPGRKILFLSRLERRKGLETLLQACTRLRDLGARIVVAGTGPEERAARKLARELRVDVTWLGRVSDDDKPRLFKAADV